MKLTTDSDNWYVVQNCKLLSQKLYEKDDSKTSSLKS